MSEEQTVIFGDNEEWKYFQVKHKAFLEKFPRLRDAIQTALLSEVRLSTSADKVVYFLCVNCLEHFSEILLLSGNGYGMAAQRALRTLYEYAVTAIYLTSNQQEANNFLDFHWIQEHKLAGKINEVFGGDAIPREKFAEIQEHYVRVRETFLVPDCKKCGTSKVNFSWSKLDFVSMAREVGEVGKLIVPAYYLALAQSHPSVRGLQSRVTHSGPGTVFFEGAAQRSEAEFALSTAHALLLSVLQTMGTYFKMTGILDVLPRLNEDHLSVWAAPKEGS